MKIKRKIIVAFTIVSGITALFTVLYYFLLPMYLTYQFKPKISGADKVTVIGGADGYTSILIANTQTAYLLTIIPIILTVLGITYLTISKRNRKGKGFDK